MNLISCNGCGVVLDKNKLEFPSEDEVYDYGGSINLSVAGYCHDQKGYFTKIQCPVCEEDIFNDVQL